MLRSTSGLAALLAAAACAHPSEAVMVSPAAPAPKKVEAPAKPAEDAAYVEIQGFS